MKRATAVEYYKWITFGISIHALVKRATEKIEKLEKLIEISIHALVKRATNKLYQNDEP
ncbi:hypothetical protein EUBSIR_01891 [[Eubacterium] siraeum DSM 15702]|uniref:Uncharacterized protein n=1 Tax=[Eubacterium] siraeum DSM 15702 TaxID=428128 RepID=B0MPT8_9FIRM|nr:hypothetical protein EUBSIR_01891 [[Eubacterium] siraeum DSM 15702]